MRKVVTRVLDGLRAVLYIRESTVEQGKGVAPEVQRKAGRNFALDAGLDVVGEYIEFESAYGPNSATRPQFMQMLADAKAGNFDVILVYDTSRFARNRIVAAETKRVLRKELGVEVIFVTQSFLSGGDPMSMMAEGMFELHDEVSSAVTSMKVSDSLAEKASNGYLLGSLPWGYIRKPGDSNNAFIDKKKRRYVKKAFELSKTGWSDLKIAHWLNDQGLRTSRGATFGKDSVRTMLTNSVYAGYISGRRDVSKAIRGKHEAIVSDELFDEVQTRRNIRGTVGQPGRPSLGYAGSKLLLCDRCGGRLHGLQMGGNKIRGYGCSRRKEFGTCDAPYVRADEIDEQLGGMIASFAPPPGVKREILRRLKEEQSGGGNDAVVTKSKLLRRRKRLQKLFLLEDITEAKYLLERQLIDAEIMALEPPQVDDLGHAADVLTNFRRFWKRETDPRERNRMLHLILKEAYVDGQVLRIVPRDVFLTYFREQA